MKNLIKRIAFMVILFIGMISLLIMPVSAQSLIDDLIIFDFTNLEYLKLLGIYILTGLGTGFAFVIFYHITMNNDGFTKKDILFVLAGPSAGFILAMMGAPQFEVIQYTLMMNLGLTGAKDGLTKVLEYGKKKEPDPEEPTG